MTDNVSTTLMVQTKYRAVPEWLRNAKRWLVFRLENKANSNKPAKVPYYVSGSRRSGTLDSADDIARLGTFDEALSVCARDRSFGLGFALGEDIDGQFWQGIDFDDVPNNPHLEPLIDQLPGYVERSPSEKGYHAIGKGEFFYGGRKDVGVEAYSAGRFFTVTGNVDEKVVIPDAPVDLKPWVNKRWPQNERQTRDPFSNPRHVYTGSPEEVDQRTIQEIRSALTFVDGTHYDDWFSVGMALKTLEGGFEIWKDWSRWWPNATPISDKGLLEKWEGDTPERTHWKSIFVRAQNAGWINPNSNLAKEIREKEQLQQIKPLVFETPPEDIFKIKPVEFIFDGQIPVGSLIIAGAPGVGKTTLLSSMVALITWLCPPFEPLRPRVKRRVIWVTEDVDQIWRLIAAMLNENAMVATRDELNDMLKVVRANRSDPKELSAQLAQLPEDLNTVNKFDRGEHVAKPLIILDTVSATLNIEDENSNSKVSEAVAAVRQAIPNSSVWFIAHTAKNHSRSTAVDEITARGAGSFGGDVQGTAIMVREEGVLEKRYFVLGKKRIAVDKNEITATVAHYETVTSAVWGDRRERFAYATLEATDFEDRQADAEEAADEEIEVRFAAAFERFKELLVALKAEGRSGYLVRNHRGLAPLVPEKYLNHERIGAKELATACGVRKSDYKTEFWLQLKGGQWASIDGDWVVFNVPFDSISELQNDVKK